MIKVLWLSNCLFSDEKIRTSGTWLYAMMEALIKTGEVQLFNITKGNVKTFTQQNATNITQWIVPVEEPQKNGLPPQKTINFIKKIESEIKPDLVHIWGTEYYWAMLAAREILSAPVILDMQGIMRSIAPVFYGGLNNSELIKCIKLKEILLPSRSLFMMKRLFEIRSESERYIIKNVNHISVQSNWVRAYVESDNRQCNIYNTGRLLRKEFYNTSPWENTDKPAPVIFTSSSGSAAYKGLHVLFRALAVVKQQYPNVQLKIAGNIKTNTITSDGYSKWLISEAKRLQINDSITWLGAMNADEIISQLKQSSVAVVPSYVESYCLALAEAMMVGTPSVVSFAAALAEAGTHNESLLYFPVGDYMACAWQILRILNDNQLAAKLSKNAREIAIERNNPGLIVNTQLDIYKKVMFSSNFYI